MELLLPTTLAALGLLKSKHDDSGDFVMFEDDCTELQSKLPARSASYGHKKHPFSSESEHSQYNNESRPLSSSTLFSRPKIFHREISLYRGRIVPTTFAKSSAAGKARFLHRLCNTHHLPQPATQNFSK